MGQTHSHGPTFHKNDHTFRNKRAGLANSKVIIFWSKSIYPSSSRNLTCVRNNSERNGQLEGYSERKCVSEDLQRCANSRCPTNGSDHNRNNNFSMWADIVLCYFLVAIPAMKVSLYFYGINYAFYIFNFWLFNNRMIYENIIQQHPNPALLMQVSVRLYFPIPIPQISSKNYGWCALAKTFVGPHSQVLVLMHIISKFIFS